MGWVEGRSVDYRWPAGEADRMRVIARDFVDLQPDVLFCRQHTGETANLKLTFHLDHSAGADHLLVGAQGHARCCKDHHVSKITRPENIAIWLSGDGKRGTRCGIARWPELGTIRHGP